MHLLQRRPQCHPQWPSPCRPWPAPRPQRCTSGWTRTPLWQCTPALHSHSRKSGPKASKDLNENLIWPHIFTAKVDTRPSHASPSAWGHTKSWQFRSHQQGKTGCRVHPSTAWTRIWTCNLARSPWPGHHLGSGVSLISNLPTRGSHRQHSSWNKSSPCQCTWCLTNGLASFTARYCIIASPWLNISDKYEAV